MEEWKQLNDYPNYEISNYGNIRNIITNKVLKQSQDNYGYKLVNLSNNGKQKVHYIHRLVAKYFLNHTYNGKVIDHIDNNKENNNINNLQIITNRLNTSKDINKSITSSKYTGVYWYGQRNKWKAVAKINNKITYLGLYKTEIEAYNAYLKAIENI